jgi:hypothetical protein
MAQTKEMRRAFAILKYVRAVLCGLLVVAWVGSCWCRFGIEVTLPLGNRRANAFLICHCGAVFHSFNAACQGDCGNKFFVNASPPEFAPYYLGEFSYDLLWEDDEYLRDLALLYIPIAWYLSALMPIAVGCLTHFRFPLWSYFVWTALVAAELAYYLR